MSSSLDALEGWSLPRLSEDWSLPHAGSTVLALMSLLTLYTLLITIYNLTLHPLSSYPGPLLNRGTVLPLLLHETLGTTVHAWSALHAKYGPVVRISPNQLSYITPAAWRDIYGARTSSSTVSTSGSSSSGEMAKEELIFPGTKFEFFHPYKPMISCDASNHARHRRAVGPAFSDRAVRGYESVLDYYVNKLLDKLEHVDTQNRTEGQTGVNVVDWFHFCMFDITSHLVFGKSFGNLDREKYHAWVGRVFPGMKLIVWAGVVAAVPGLGRVVSWLIPQAVVDEARRHVEGIKNMVDERCGMELKERDFMSHILPNVGDKGLVRDELYLNAQLLCIAGSETTASLLAGTVYFLSRPENVRHRERLARELTMQFASEEEMTPGSLNQRAPFLAAVLNEGLRLYPPGAINMPRTVPAGGATIDGRYVPGGTVVGIAQFAAYRSPTHWVDPLTFAPERWLPGEPGFQRYADDRREAFKPFSSGPRNCVGQNLAVAECRLIIARLFWRFDVQVLPGQERWIHQRTFLGWEKPPLRVCFQRRTEMS
ncbi:hypothetical protein OQA88_5897 [Cercophora sp. LCS_1]